MVNAGSYVPLCFRILLSMLMNSLLFIPCIRKELLMVPLPYFMHTGATNLVRPSMGSWISYGLGTENHNLPAFVTISPSSSKGGPRNYGNAFLPSIHQGTALGRAGNVNGAKIRNVENAMLTILKEKVALIYCRI